MTFTDALTLHRKQYPLMQPQDYVKLAYQNVFGPEHLLEGREETLLSNLRAEWESIPSGDVLLPPDDIGDGLCRFHLTNTYLPQDAAPLLIRLFRRSIKQPPGTMTDLSNKLEQLAALDVPGMQGFLTTYQKHNCPPVRHSDTYRTAYHPHYRLLTVPCALFFPLMMRITALLQSDAASIIVAIDGRSGSGKTNLAALLARVFSCNVYHMDDFYRPSRSRPEDWRDIPGGNMDLARFQSEVLTPIRQGLPVAYRSYDCRRDAYRPGIQVPSKRLNIVEGSYSHHPLLRDSCDLRVLLTCSKAVQAARLRRREGEQFPDYVSTWIPLEERYLEECQIAENASLLFDTSRLE